MAHKQLKTFHLFAGAGGGMSNATFDDFWKRTQEQFKRLLIAERNHYKRLGIAPDINTSKAAYRCLQIIPLRQPELDLQSKEVKTDLRNADEIHPLQSEGEAL